MFYDGQSLFKTMLVETSLEQRQLRWRSRGQQQRDESIINHYISWNRRLLHYAMKRVAKCEPCTNILKLSSCSSTWFQFFYVQKLLGGESQQIRTLNITSFVFNVEYLQPNEQFFFIPRQMTGLHKTATFSPLSGSPSAEARRCWEAAVPRSVHR